MKFTTQAVAALLLISSPVTATPTTTAAPVVNVKFNEEFTLSFIADGTTYRFTEEISYTILDSDNENTRCEFWNMNREPAQGITGANKIEIELPQWALWIRCNLLTLKTMNTMTEVSVHSLERVVIVKEVEDL